MFRNEFKPIQRAQWMNPIGLQGPRPHRHPMFEVHANFAGNRQTDLATQTKFTRGCKSPRFTRSRSRQIPPHRRCHPLFCFQIHSQNQSKLRTRSQFRRSASTSHGFGASSSVGFHRVFRSSSSFCSESECGAGPNSSGPPASVSVAVSAREKSLQQLAFSDSVPIRIALATFRALSFFCFCESPTPGASSRAYSRTRTNSAAASADLAVVAVVASLLLLFGCYPCCFGLFLGLCLCLGLGYCLSFSFGFGFGFGFEFGIRS